MKNNLRLYYIMCFLLHIIHLKLLPIYVMLPLHTEQNNKKKNNLIQEQDEFIVLYKGAEYKIPISSLFGAQVIFKDDEFISKYYIMICEKLHLNLDNKGNVKGYNLNDIPSNLYKMYVVKINIFNNNKNEMTYNWNIEEIETLLKSIPENTIIVYGNPNTISLRNFGLNFNKSCPAIESNRPGMLILPTLSIHCDNFKETLHKNANASLETKIGHSTIKQQLN